MRKILIRLPIFYSYQDEEYCFLWLSNLNAVKEFRVTQNGCEITCNSRLIKSDLRDLIAWMTRYSIDKRGLSVFCNAANVKWFKNPVAYWYSSVFGDLR
jgi:hypothetical protein